MDSEVRKHLELVRIFSFPGRDLAADSRYATVNQAEWFARMPGGELRSRAVRSKLHRDIKRDYLRAHPGVPAERKAIILAGPPGAGKGSVLKYLDWINEDDYVRVDPDRVKEMLLMRAIQDGSFEAKIKSPTIRNLEVARGAKFFPLEFASLVHEESSIICRRMRGEIIRGGLNLIVDGVLANVDKALLLASELEGNGYEISIIDIETSRELSSEGILQRWEAERWRALSGEVGSLGGRWVPDILTEEVFGAPGGRSWPEEAAGQVAYDIGAVLLYQVWRRLAQAAAPVLETHMIRSRPGGELEDHVSD